MAVALRLCWIGDKYGRDASIFQFSELRYSSTSADTFPSAFRMPLVPGVMDAVLELSFPQKKTFDPAMQHTQSIPSHGIDRPSAALLHLAGLSPDLRDDGLLNVVHLTAVMRLAGMTDSQTQF